jgi:hypothetical protein
MKKEELLADIAKIHKELTATNMNNSSFCLPIAGNDPTFVVTWNHDAPAQVMLYVYSGKCEFSYGPNDASNNPTVFLDSQDGQGGYVAKVNTLSGQSVAVDLNSYINLAVPGGFTAVGVSW